MKERLLEGEVWYQRERAGMNNKGWNAEWSEEFLSRDQKIAAEGKNSTEIRRRGRR